MLLGDKIVTAGEVGMFLYVIVSGNVQLQALRSDFSHSGAAFTNGNNTASVSRDDDGKYI